MISTLQCHDLLDRLFADRPVLITASLLTVGVLLSAWWAVSIIVRTSNEQPIKILSATYGNNCRDFIPTVGENLVFEGNATSVIRSGCVVSDNQCSLIYRQHWADPAPACGKDVTILYLCPGSQEPKSAYIIAEAIGRRVTLDCNVWVDPSQAPPTDVNRVACGHLPACETDVRASR